MMVMVCGGRIDARVRTRPENQRNKKYNSAAASPAGARAKGHATRVQSAPWKNSISQ
ncbi:hypothetical protein [Burkholderia pseudomallei]|uniref:hypothetical protein n=1 Tax=Burkholderia pseudomallei TaxID=28450 RepID=UPI00130ED6A2|nr:hypothetical protein [Burkholderia pseudomallei]